MNQTGIKLTNGYQQNFVFLSSILGLPVRDVASNARLGKVFDLIAVLRETYPAITGLIIKRRGKKDHFHIPWGDVKSLNVGKEIIVESASMVPEKAVSFGNRIFLRESFLDQQVVDLSGAKVVRVNDLHLLKEQSNLWLVHMDVGFSGLLRRLGWLKIYTRIIKWLFGYEIVDKLISWKHVQPVMSENFSQALQLKVNHSKMSELHPADISEILADLGVEEREIVFGALEEDVAADTLEELPLKLRVQMAESLGLNKLARIIDDMPVDEAVDLLANLKPRHVNSIYKLLPADQVKLMRELSKHSDDLAGSIMNTQYITANPGDTASKIIEKLKNEAEEAESFHYVYVLDDQGTLVGLITLRQLLIADPHDLASDFMRKKIVKVEVDTDLREVAQIFTKYDFALVPVVDTQDKLLGIITMKDALETIYS
jgi:magnesium transporter